MPTFLVAQAVIEHSALTSIGQAFDTARYQLETFVGQGNGPWTAVGLLVLLMIVIVWRA